MSRAAWSSALPCIAACAAVLTTTPVLAGPIFPGTAAPAIEITQRVGARLPLDLRFTDADGRAARLGDFFPGRGGVPVVLVLGYYRCPRLCETVMEGAIDALAASGLPRSAYRIVAVSIDPAETPADAAARRRLAMAYADTAAAREAALPNAERDGSHGPAPVAWTGAPSTARPQADAAVDPLRLQALVGDAASIDALAAQVGFGFRRAAGAARRDGDAAVFDHAAGFVVATPDGRVSGYVLGLRHDPAAVRATLATARDDRVGGLVDRLVLLCAHIDPSLGRWSQAVLVGLRVLGSALVLALLAWIWRHRRAPPAKVRP